MRGVGLLAVLAAVSLASIGGFAIGGRHGFYAGYLVASYTASVSLAGRLLQPLAAHDRGECQAARPMLETIVDGALISDWAHHEHFATPPFYAPSQAYKPNVTKVLQLLAEYREAHSHEIPEPGASAVRATLARFAVHQGGS